MPRVLPPSAMPLLLAVALLGVGAAAAAASLSLPRALSQLSVSAAASSGDPCGTGAGPCSPCKKHRGSCCGSFPNGSFCCAGGAASVGGVCPVAPCTPRRCPAHTNRTFCPNNPAPDQCNKPPAPCPPGPCPPAPTPTPSPPPPAQPANCAYVTESATGPGVSDYAKGIGHYACVPSQPAEVPRLLLFPVALAANDYTKIIQTAAEVGMHAIGLMYQNKPGAFGGWKSGVCGDAATGYPNSMNTSEELCVHHVELMKTFGQGDPRVPANRANYVLSRENSIVGRTEAALRYLSNRSTSPPASLGPASSWVPFLNASGAPEWTKITVGGHSRASTYPPLLAKYYPIQRGVMWGGAGDYVNHSGTPAAWLSEPSLVNGSNMYACDPALACNAFRRNYDALKMPGLAFFSKANATGGSTTVAAALGGARQLFSTELCCDCNNSSPHMCNIGDQWGPYDPPHHHDMFHPKPCTKATPCGKNQLVDIWKYMLTNNAPPSAAALALQKNFPYPCSDSPVVNRSEQMFSCKIPPVPPVPPECTSPAPFLPRYHFIGPPSAHLNAGNEGSGSFPDNANDANALFYHGGYLHAMHQTATLWGNPRAGRDKGGSFEHFSHLISRDFAHWERLPDACRKADSKPWNSNPQGGCYDGAVSLLPPPHGPIMLYEPRPYGVGKPIPLILVKAVNASDPKLINWDQNNSKIVHLKIAPPGSTLRGWCNTSTNASSLECVPSSVWQSGDHLNFVAGGSRWYTPANGDLDVWTQDPRPFVDGKPFGDAGSQSFVPLPKLVDGTVLPDGGPNFMIASGGGLRFGVYDHHTETFTSSLAADGRPISSGISTGKFGWMITNDCNGRTVSFGWLAATCGNCKPQVAPQRLSLVLELRYDPRFQRLVTNPLDELSLLHADIIASRSHLSLEAGQREVVVPETTLTARSMDLQANVTIVDGGQDVRFAVLSPDSAANVGQGAVIDVNVTGRAADGSRNGTVYVWTESYPRARATAKDESTGGANFTASFAILPGETSVDVRALVDFSSVEVFVMGGRAAISLSIVPNCTEAQFAKDKCAAGQVQSGVSVSSHSGATVNDLVLHEMSCMWTGSVDPK